MDDESNKAVVIGNRMGFGYTGLAKIGAEPTDAWLASTAAEVPSTDLKAVCDHIARRATEAFANLRIDRRLSRHAFIGVGWTARIGSAALHPTLCTISNAIDGSGEWKPLADPSFTLQVNNWDRFGAGFGIAAAGQTLRREEKYAMWRLIRRCVKKGTGPPAILRALVIAMNYSATKYNSVGRSLMALCMPRAAVERFMETGEAIFLAGVPLTEQNTFRYLRPGGSPVTYGPLFALHGWAVLGFESGPVKPDAPKS
ncbi:MAG TPA: hypothetical protein VFZ21_24655 [Gemmatimonadaceae bacterium]|nr:hypothetical protein [Gemmatimonadaceae bacterium]